MPSDWCQENGRGSRYEQVVGIVGIIQDWRGFRWWTARSGCLDQLTRVGFGRPVILQMWSMRAWLGVVSAIVQGGYCPRCHVHRQPRNLPPVPA